jgi:hypothetical protein
MNIKGVLVEGRDGREYLLGFRREVSGQLTGPPTLSRRGPGGAFEPFEDTVQASKVALAQLCPRGGGVIGPGWGKDLFLWRTFAAALDALPRVPTWPTWHAGE